MMNSIISCLEEKHKKLWGAHTVKLRHELAQSDLFTDAGIAKLIDQLPHGRIAINTMSPGIPNRDSWSYCDRGTAPGADILEIVKRGRLWINMTRLETVDQRFEELLEAMFKEFEDFFSDFKTFKRSIGLLVSSPSAQVFYHADVPGQTLWQLRGRKRIFIYPAQAPFLQPREIENVVRAITEEEMEYRAWYDEYAEVHELEAGDMLHWKLNGPHRVVNLDTLNVSLTTEHYTTAIRRNYAMNYGNGVLRELGFSPRSRHLKGPAFWGKVALTALCRSLPLHTERSFKRVVKFRIAPKTETGLVPL